MNDNYQLGGTVSASVPDIAKRIRKTKIVLSEAAAHLNNTMISHQTNEATFANQPVPTIRLAAIASSSSDKVSNGEVSNAASSITATTRMEKTPVPTLTPKQVKNSTASSPPIASNFHVITRIGSKLFDNGTLFRFISYNVPNYLLLEGRGSEWVAPTPYEQDDAMRSISGSFGQVARTYTLGFGPNYHISGPGKYNEDAFIAFDHGLAIARDNGIRLIIPLVNNHWGDDNASLAYGDYGIIAKFRDLPPSEFYKSSVLRNDLKDLIFYILNRINTVNGIRYFNR